MTAQPSTNIAKLQDSTNIAKLRSWTSGGVSILCRYRVFAWLRDRGHVEKAEQWNHVSSWDLFLYLCKNIPWFQQRHCHMVMQSIYKQVKNSLFSIILVYAWFTSVVFTIMLELLNRKESEFLLYSVTVPVFCLCFQLDSWPRCWNGHYYW